MTVLVREKNVWMGGSVKSSGKGNLGKSILYEKDLFYLKKKMY